MLFEFKKKKKEKINHALAGLKVFFGLGRHLIMLDFL